ncbi:MAG: hypothetical protein FJ303_21995 [Planctomycetes bacterium]|nr:hypothetical protein [Planctomycetota bacterium]
MRFLPYYPESPTNVPAEPTRPSPWHRARIGALAILLALFFLTYVAVSLLCVGYIVWATLVCTWDDWLVGNTVALVMIVPVGGLLAYWLAALGSIRSAPLPDGDEIFEFDHPALFAFIAQLCDEIGVARPTRVFLDDRVNASVLLELPDGMGLVIGRGLVDCLCLSEFKAILAHEIGHCTQGSVALNRYVRVAGQLVRYFMQEDGVTERTLRGWAALPLLLGVPASAILGAWRLVRWLLRGYWGFVHAAHEALAREEELHADRIAVRIAGSDALVDALAKCACSEPLSQPLALAGGAAAAAGAHPTDAERELNATAIPVPAQRDPRPARVLFEDADAESYDFLSQYGCAVDA